MVWMCVKDFQTLTLCRPKFLPHFGPCTDKWQKIFENIYPKTPENQFLAAYICIFEKNFVKLMKESNDFTEV